MNSIQERIEAAKLGALPARLKRGAEILGALWAEGQRCATGGWSRHCTCADGRTDFCAAKLRWVTLLLDLGPDHLADLTGEEPMFVIEAMTIRQLAATKLTVLIAHDGISPKIAVGSHGTDWESMINIVTSPDPAAAWQAAAKVLDMMTSPATSHSAAGECVCGKVHP
jgi:hypothetical protein